MKLPSDTALIVGGVAVVAVVGLIAAHKAAKVVPDAAAAVGGAINPVSDQNIFYRGVNAIGGALTGDSNFNLGVWIYDKTNPPLDYNASPNEGGEL